VTLVFATSGDAGPGTSGLPPGTELAGLREREGTCASEALGLGTPTFWRLGDGTLATMARAPESSAREALRLTAEAIALAEPDVVMTWGPDGGYGHADHRMISALVTQVVAGIEVDRPDLLYAAFPQVEGGTPPQFERWATTAPTLLTDRIAYERADLAATEAALGCYESQFPAEARAGLARMLHERVWRGTVFFRLALPGTE
jgi:LmbE family N-acetylglucosaminyl deacetylase